ncbi:MAG TPA: hypothetical protein DCL48_08635, partial [Alphaproteobacteria bacterium]|nr:hypothetical protein [Alphaproteobacteria bacterium]
MSLALALSRQGFVIHSNRLTGQIAPDRFDKVLDIDWLWYQTVKTCVGHLCGVGFSGRSGDGKNDGMAAS